MFDWSAAYCSTTPLTTKAIGDSAPEPLLILAANTRWSFSSSNTEGQVLMPSGDTRLSGDG